MKWRRLKHPRKWLRRWRHWMERQSVWIMGDDPTHVEQATWARPRHPEVARRVGLALGAGEPLTLTITAPTVHLAACRLILECGGAVQVAGAGVSEW